MKKMLVGLSIVLLAVVALSGCGGSSGTGAESMENFDNQVNKITVTTSHDTDPQGIQGKLYGDVTEVKKEDNQTFIKVNARQMKIDGQNATPVIGLTDSPLVLNVMSPNAKVAKGDKIEATIVGQKTEAGYTLTAIQLRQIKES